MPGCGHMYIDLGFFHCNFDFWENLAKFLVKAKSANPTQLPNWGWPQSAVIVPSLKGEGSSFIGMFLGCTDACNQSYNYNIII